MFGRDDAILSSPFAGTAVLSPQAIVAQASNAEVFTELRLFIRMSYILTNLLELTNH
jgi:hypothetical protein